MVLSLIALRSDAAFGDVYEPADELEVEADFEDFVAESELELDAAELDSIDSSVESLAESFKEQVKHHIQEQVKARKLATSKFAQSKVAIQHSALHVAAAQNQYEKVAKLLASGEDPNTQLPTGITPLHSAASEGYKDIVGLLLANNASVDALGPHGATALHLAAHRGRASVTELLLREGAEVNALAGSFAQTPLYMASEMGHTRVVAALLGANASIELQAAIGSDMEPTRDPMHMCCVAMAKACRAHLNTTCGSTQTLTHSHQPAHLGAQAHDGSTALLMAAREGHEEVVKLLLDAGAYVDATDGRQARPIAWAQVLGHTEVVELFLAAGAKAVTPEEEEAFKSPTGHHRVEIKPFLQF